MNHLYPAITALAKSSKNKHSAMLSSSSPTLEVKQRSIDSQQDLGQEEDQHLWPKALDLLDQMNQDGIEPDGFCYSSAINCCGAEGRWKEACQLIDKMRRGSPKNRPNKIAYTACISACGRAGQASKALELFQDMKDDGIPADRVAYNALFSALRVSEDADKVSEEETERNRRIIVIEDIIKYLVTHTRAHKQYIYIYIHIIHRRMNYGVKYVERDP